MKRFFQNILVFVVIFILLKPDAMAGESPYVSSLSKEGCGKNALMLVSFNGKDFGATKSPEELEYLVKLFSPADIIALQEVVAKKGGTQAVARFDEALDRTGASWDYHVSEATLGSEQERFAALWKPSSVKFLKPKSGLVLELDGLVRNPYAAFFQWKNSYFGVYSFHLAPTKKNPLNEARIVAENKKYFDIENSFFVGDFNLSGNELSEYFEKKLGGTRQIFAKTSLNMKLGKNGNYFHSEYDNIFTHGKVRVCKSGVVDFVPHFRDLKSARSLSDHLPVFVVFTME